MVVIRTFEGHLSDVHNVRFNANGLWLASTGLDKTVKLWQVSLAIKKFSEWETKLRFNNFWF